MYVEQKVEVEEGDEEEDNGGEVYEWELSDGLFCNYEEYVCFYGNLFVIGMFFIIKILRKVGVDLEYSICYFCWDKEVDVFQFFWIDL